jgi:hypothetical protein
MIQIPWETGLHYFGTCYELLLSREMNVSLHVLDSDSLDFHITLRPA